MSRRRRFLISAFVVAACIAVTIGVLAMLPCAEASYLRIKEGMTRAEVETILGHPSAGHASWRKIIIFPRPSLPLGGTELRWREYSEIIIVQFDKNEIAIHKSILASLTH